MSFDYLFSSSAIILINSYATSVHIKYFYVFVFYSFVLSLFIRVHHGLLKKIVLAREVRARNVCLYMRMYVFTTRMKLWNNIRLL